MKRLLIVIAACAIVSPNAFAENTAAAQNAPAKQTEQQKQAPKSASAAAQAAAANQNRVPVQTRQLSSGTTKSAVAQDSPLVAAAKRANRLGKSPAYVITNENLIPSGASTRGVTTTKNQGIISIDPFEKSDPTAEQAAQEAQFRKTEQQKADAQMKQLNALRKTLVEQLSVQLQDEDGMHDIDPAKLEKQLQELVKQQQQGQGQQQQ